MKSYFAFAALAFAVFLTFFSGVYYHIRSSNPPSSIAQESHQFYRDNITLLSHDAGGTPILFIMDFNRKEVEGKFIHYYLGTLWYGDREQSFASRFDFNGSAIQARDFIGAYDFKPFSDLSTRVRHDLKILSDFGELSVEIEMDGDFLTKNMPHHTRFSSVASSKILFGGRVHPARVLWESTYSSDYLKTIFFEGRNNLDSETHLFSLWDQEGNFYHLDQTEVKQNDERYPDHTWVLFKDAFTGSTQKSYEATLRLDDAGVDIMLPEWRKNIRLNAPRNWKIYDSKGYIQGMLEHGDGTSKGVEGFYENVVF